MVAPSLSVFPSGDRILSVARQKAFCCGTENILSDSEMWVVQDFEVDLFLSGRLEALPRKLLPTAPEEVRQAASVDQPSDGEAPHHGK